ncbi:MAG: PEP/pyruvate-binding domain-containing protein [Elusimicrobiales bacterium]
MEIKGSEIFEKLMPWRVKSILIVASLYDSFMFIDDNMFLDSLGYYARDGIEIEKAKNTDDAIKILQQKKFDIVISVIQTAEFDMELFVREVKEKHSTHLVILSFSMQDISALSDYVRNSADYIFLWQGDTRIFSSIINLIEDSNNLEHDLSLGVQCVMLVEDNIRFYSMYLPVIYNEMIKQMQLVMADDMSSSRRMMRMRARPKIVLLNNYDDAWLFFERYKNNLLGIITDVEYPMSEVSDEKAGVILAKRVKSDIPDMPVLIQSSNQIYEKKAIEIGASFLNKNSQDLSRQLRSFITRYFGFGDFIFDDGNGKEIARASDLQSMIKILRTIPEKSLLYHASRNHFSKWLLARTEFEIAYKIRPKKIEEFSSPAEIRNYLIETIHQFIYTTHLGVILRYDRNRHSFDIPFAKIGSGSVGGKARGLAFLNYLIGRGLIPDEIDCVKIKTPNSVVVASDVFDFFIEHNNLDEFVLREYSEEELVSIFLNVNLPDYAARDILSLVDKINGPIAVRSSSILEDSKNYPFAGVYKTYLLPHLDRKIDNYSLIEKAIKLIYASVFSKEARELKRMNPTIPEEEKMSVIIQEVVGSQHVSGYHFPLISGVLQSYNFYPVYPLKAEDPIAHIACGLGEIVVSGRYFLRYSPSNPSVIHQFSSVSDILDNSQKKIVAVSLDKKTDIFYSGCSSVKEINVDNLVPSDDMSRLYSTYRIDDDRVVDGYSTDGIPLLTMLPFIKENTAINKVMCEIVKRVADYMGSNVEIEFAVDKKDHFLEFYLLQVRNLNSKFSTRKYTFNEEEYIEIIHSQKTVGNSFINNIYDIVFVKKENFSNLLTPDIALEISAVNMRFKSEGKNYILIGPGRWGTSDRYLGIPVKWNDISMSRMIAELSFEDFNIEPSYGTHFFHNIIAMNIPYFTISSSDISWDRIYEMETLYEGRYIKHVRSKTPLVIVAQDGKGGVFAKIT